jgi:hypothetical protein
MTVKLNEPQGRPTLTVTYTVKPNEPHGYPTLTVTMTVKLTEPQATAMIMANKSILLDDEAEIRAPFASSLLTKSLGCPWMQIWGARYTGVERTKL